MAQKDLVPLTSIFHPLTIFLGLARLPPEVRDTPTTTLVITPLCLGFHFSQLHSTPCERHNLPSASDQGLSFALTFRRLPASDRVFTLWPVAPAESDNSLYLWCI